MGFQPYTSNPNVSSLISGDGSPKPVASSALLITHPTPRPAGGSTDTPCISLVCVCQWLSFLPGPHTRSSSSPLVSLTFSIHVSENLPSLTPSRPLPRDFMDPVPASARHSSYYMDVLCSHFSSSRWTVGSMHVLIPFLAVSSVLATEQARNENLLI